MLPKPVCDAHFRISEWRTRRSYALKVRVIGLLAVAICGVAGFKGVAKSAADTAIMARHGYEPERMDESGSAVGYVNRKTGDFQSDLESARAAHSDW